MNTIILKDNTIIGNFCKPYFIAEVNSSHNGNLDTAKQMIIEAKKAGCSCVKFQSWSADTLYSKSYYKENPIAKRIVQKFALTPDQLKVCASFCKENDIGFSSTPYSIAEVDTLLDFGVPFVKIASMDINNYEFIRYIANSGIPIVLSTGMAELAEIHKAVDVIKATANKNLALLHCISIYPSSPDLIHLNNIPMLQNEFPDYPIGFSDHTLGYEIACGATALGVSIIEKHLTLDKTRPGMDNNMALEPQELSNLVSACNNVYQAMGSKERIVSNDEYNQRLKMRRSLIVNKAMPAGSVLTLSDIDAKRPGTGISVEQLDSVIGKTLKHDVESDTLLSENDFC